MARVTREVFAYSRNPLEIVLSGARDDPRWFEQHGVAATRRFLRSLRAHPDVKRADLTITEQTRRDAFGSYASFRVKLSLAIRDHAPFTVDGSGHMPDRSIARVIAFAELLERVAIEVNFAVHGTRMARMTRPAVGDWGSNGACFHSSAVRVLKGALCELLERDAFLTSWYAGRALPHASIGRGHPLFTLATRLDRAGWRLTEHAWTHDKVDAACVYLSAIRKQPVADGWNFFLGGGAAPTRREAIAKAETEFLRMFRTWQAAYQVVDHAGRASPKILANVVSRLLIYQRPAYIREFERMTSARPRSSNRGLRPRSDHAFIVDCMRALGDVRIVSLPVPAALRDRVFCIKALSEQLQDLDWRIPPNFNVDRIAGLYGTRRADLNRFPHPIA